MNNHTVQLGVMLVLGIAIGVVGTRLMGPENIDPNEDMDEGTEISTSTEGAMFEDGELLAGTSELLPGKEAVPQNSRIGLVVSDQPAGGTVAVSGFTLVSPQWIAVYDDRGGKPGWILGAKRFLPGDSSGIVTLLRETVAGETYYAVFHEDDGDLIFDKRKDSAPMPDRAIMVTFKAN